MPDQPCTERGVYETCEAPCSSVLLNCLQWPLNTPTRDLLIPPSPDEAAKATTTALTADWMHGLKMLQQQEQQQPIRILDLVWPGSHDATSCRIPCWQPYSAIRRTQSLSVTEQLQAGIRFLHVRVDRPTDQWYCNSDDCSSGWKQTLQEIVVFLSDHPSEIVLIQVTPSHHMRKYHLGNDGKALIDAIQSIVPPEWCVTADQWQALKMATLQGWQKAGFRLGVILDASLLVSVDDRSSLPLACTTDVLWSPWHNTRSTELLMEWNLQACRERRPSDGRLFGSQLVLTPGVGESFFDDVFGLFSGANSLRPDVWAARLYQTGQLLDTTLCDAEANWNVVLLDFVQLCPDVIEYCVALNYHVPLTILMAVLVSTNKNHHRVVTDKVQRKVQKGRVLRIRPSENLLEGHGDDDDGYEFLTLLLVYRLGTKALAVQVDATNDTTPLVVSGYNTCLPSPPVELTGTGYIIPVTTGDKCAAFDTVITETKPGDQPAVYFQHTSHSTDPCHVEWQSSEQE